MWIALQAALAAPPSYTVAFPGRTHHLVDVTAQLAAEPDGTTGLFMATWTPGSYLIREYAQHVEDLTATGPDGAALDVRKSAKNRWEVDTTGLTSFTLHYRVYARAMSVQGNWVDADFAVLNGAPTWIVPDDLKGPYAITVARPADWARTISPLADAGDTFVAPSYDVLVDSPLVVGNPTVTEFEVEGVPHLLVDVPPSAPWDSAKAAAAVEREARQAAAFWGVVPYDRYVYVNVLGEAGGGLEHLGSTHMITSRRNTTKDEDFQRWLGLVAHEHFHAWNVKRLRPVALGPFDYEHEVRTESLWIAEGFTSYYDDLLLVRAGLIDQAEYLKRMSKNLEGLDGTPGRLHQPVARASEDAWIEYYRRDEHSENSAVSYYTKGAVIGLVLDARIREATNGARSLDDAMRLAYARYSGERGYEPEEFIAVLSEVAGRDLAPLVHRLTWSTEEVDLAPALAWFGLAREPSGDDPKPWLGVKMTGDRVVGVVRDGPAWAAGLNVDDEILGVAGERVLGGSVDAFAPGASVEILVARRGQLRTLEAVLGTKADSGPLKPDPDASKRTLKQREAWIGPSEPKPK